VLLVVVEVVEAREEMVVMLLQEVVHIQVPLEVWVVSQELVVKQMPEDLWD
jgi:hypothetical protein